MSAELLSQDEVDALLKGVRGEEDPPPLPEEPGTVRPYNLATHERIVRGRMPTMEIINDRFARLLRLGLFNFMRRNPEISVGPIRAIQYGEFLRNLVVPTNLNIMQPRPLRGSALFVIEPTLVFPVVDNMFGGDGRFHTRVEGRDFTATEQRIIQRMLEVITIEYQKAWAGIYPLHFEYVRSEMHTQFANIATPTEIVVVSTFNVELGAGGGAFHICIPYATLEPIRNLIYSSVPGDLAESDGRWLRTLTQQVQLAEVELVAQLSTVQIRVRDLLDVKVGDVLPLDISPKIKASVDGVALLECQYGMLNGKYALRVDRLIRPEPDPISPGAPHA
ncbi:MAG: flagellar motor switch protein FliM [Betaproteobacteria bacterium]